MSRRGDGSEGEGENPFYMQAVRQQFERMNVVCNEIIDRLERLEQKELMFLNCSVGEDS